MKKPTTRHVHVLQVLSIFLLGVSIFLLLRIDFLIHERLYEFGLEFDLIWANDYWLLVRLCLGLLGVGVAISVAALIFDGHWILGATSTLRSWANSSVEELRPILRETKFVLRRLRKNPFSLVGGVIVLFFFGLALFAPLIAPPEPGMDPYLLKVREDWHSPVITPPPTLPSPEHPFGTVAGYDIFYGCIWGTRTALRIGLLVTVSAVAIGLFIGCIAGYFGGVADELLMRFTDVFFGIPSLLLALLLIVIMPSSWPIDLGFIKVNLVLSTYEKIIVIFVLTGWPTYARLIRGEVVKVKNEDYVEAARAVGCSHTRTILRHIIPNSIFPVIAMATLNIGGVILAASTLNFLDIRTIRPTGFSQELQFGYADWALFIADSRDWIIAAEGLKYAYTFIIPSSFLVTFVLGWTLLGDTMRDLLDPVFRRR